MLIRKPTVTNALLSAKKSKILGVFTSMQQELQQLHDQQKEYADTVKKQLKELSDELTAVETSRAETTNTIKKIDNILK
jgi:uncharacterized protein involved in exopolysaccharide biosynthesis